MHSLKRKAAQDEDSSRKSARTSETPTPPGFDDQDPTPAELTPIEPITGRVQVSIGPLKLFIERYNSIRSFIPSSGVKYKHVQEAQIKIAEARERIVTSFNGLLGSIDREITEMKRVTKCMQRSALVGTNWYRNGNLLVDLEFDLCQLEELFDNYRIEDAKDFAEYLLGIVRDDWHYLRDDRLSLLRKRLRDSTDDRAGYHIFHFESALLFEIGSQYSERRISNARARLAEELRESMTSTLRAHKAQWLDCAAARRRIWQSYKMTWSCPLKREADYESYTDCLNLEKFGLCWHQIDLHLLGALHKAAHREIRNNVLLTIDNRLPQELADLVIDAALISEEVPLHESIGMPDLDMSKRPPALLEQYECGRNLHWRDPDLEPNLASKHQSRFEC